MSAPPSSPGPDRVRAVRSLARRSVRARQGAFLAEGPQAVREAVRCAPHKVREVFVAPQAQERHGAVVSAAQECGITVRLVTDEVLAQICDARTPQGILAVCRRIDVPVHVVLREGPHTLAVLGQVRDPGNAGTVIRAADAAGVDAVVLSRGCVDVFNPKVVRASAGSLFHLPIAIGPALPELIGLLTERGIGTLAADTGGSTDLDAAGPLLLAPHAWVLGNEAWGLSTEVLQACSASVRIPIHGRAESLNLAMAATLCLYASAGHRPHRADNGYGAIGGRYEGSGAMA